MKVAISEPTQIIILGGSGDLSNRKLIPALLDLYARGGLPERFNIIALARTPRTDEEYREFVRNSIENHEVKHSHSDETVNDFCSNISYVSGSFDDINSYSRLKKSIEEFESELGNSSHKLFYLAVHPRYYEDIFTDLKESGVSDSPANKWTHILVEKPFGNDLATAQELDTKLASLYDENQIFRIDHYLAKEAVQNILSFRFANTILKTGWDKNSVKSVEIKMSETIDIGERSGFYEEVGALRDVGQNHLLQLLALVAMREPANFDAESVRLGRAEVLKSLRPIKSESLNEQVVRAQYEGYRTSKGVNKDSNTETYFELKTFVDLPEWQDVPFYVKAGKALDVAEVSIVINFHDVASGLFKTETCKSVENKIKLQIQPEQMMSVTLNAKKPGLGYQLESRTLSFKCNQGDEEITNSYEKVLYDSISGDHTLFTRTEEVIAAWEFITPIIEKWNELPLHTYKKGTSGPHNHIK